MWNYFSNDTGYFPKLDEIDRNYIEGESGKQFVTSSNVFSTCMMSKFKTVLYGKKYICWSPEVMLESIGIVFVML